LVSGGAECQQCTSHTLQGSPDERRVRAAKGQAKARKGLAANSAFGFGPSKKRRSPRFCFSRTLMSAKGKGGPEGVERSLSGVGPDRQVSLRKAARCGSRQGSRSAQDKTEGALRVRLRRHPKNAEHPSLVSTGPRPLIRCLQSALDRCAEPLAREAPGANVVRHVRTLLAPHVLSFEPPDFQPARPNAGSFIWPRPPLGRSAAGKQLGKKDRTSSTGLGQDRANTAGDPAHALPNDAALARPAL
jgi:hypothetical protein